MSGGLAAVREHFDGLGLRYEYRPGSRVIRSGMRCRNGAYHFLVTEQENGVLLFLIPGYMLVRPQHRAAVLERVCDLNYRLALGRICVDASDGEMTVEVAFPPMESLSRVQVSLALAALFSTADDHLRELTLLNLTGERPREESPLERLGYGTPDRDPGSAAPGSAADGPLPAPGRPNPRRPWRRLFGLPDADAA